MHNGLNPAATQIAISATGHEAACLLALVQLRIATPGLLLLRCLLLLLPLCLYVGGAICLLLRRTCSKGSHDFHAGLTTTTLLFLAFKHL